MKFGQYVGIIVSCFSSPTNVDLHKCRHMQISPQIHPQSPNSLRKSRVYDDENS